MTLDTGLQRRSFPRPLVTAQVWFAGERVKSQGFILEMPRADDDRGFPPRSMSSKDLACKNTCIWIISSSMFSLRLSWSSFPRFPVQNNLSEITCFSSSPYLLIGIANIWPADEWGSCAPVLFLFTEWPPVYQVTPQTCSRHIAPHSAVGFSCLTLLTCTKEKQRFFFMFIICKFGSFHKLL